MPADLKPGDPAPDFSASATDGSTVSLSDFRGKSNVVLFFYVKDNTPGCTREARAFRDAVDAFGERKTVVLGVGIGSIESHRRFAENNELDYRLLADPDGAIAKSYGVLTNTGMAERATFLIDSSGVVRRVWRKVSITGHTAEILEAIDEAGLG